MQSAVAARVNAAALLARFTGMIFDVDGVLLRAPHQDAWTQALLQLIESEWRALAGAAAEAAVRDPSFYDRHISGKPRLDGAGSALWQLGIPDAGGARAEHLARTKAAIFDGLVEAGQVEPYADGVGLAVWATVAGKALAVASSSKNAERLLGAVRLDLELPTAYGKEATLLDLFAANVSGRDGLRGKPAPDIFLAATAALRLPISECLVVEDAPAGVTAARSAGMACLAVGQFFSALTQNQIVAALITVSVLLGFWFVGHLQTFQTSYALRRLFGYLSFALHFADFIQGLVRSEAVMFYLVVCAIALTLNASYLHWRR